MLRCPRCGYEYMPGRTMCPGCCLPLVDSESGSEPTLLQPRGKKMKKEVIPVVVYRAQGQLEANVVKSKLESEGIPAILQYESAGIVYGMTFDGLGEVRVLVPEPLRAEAQQVLAEARFRRPDFEHDLGGHSDDDDDEDATEHGEHAEEDQDNEDDDEDE